MSQHTFQTLHNGQETCVLMGWDRPLQGYFLVIEKETDGDEPFWSNLLHHTPIHPKSLQSFLAVLAELGINIPNQMIAEIEEDGRMDMGNKLVAHFLEDGLYYRSEG